MADGDAGRCEPYRVEIRSSLTSPWRRFDTRGTLGEAEALARHALAHHGHQARVLEQRVVLVRGLGQDGGPDQAFTDYTRRMATLAGSVADRNERIHGTSSEPEGPEQAMPDGLFFSERELWKTATLEEIDGQQVRDVLARLARVRAELRAHRGPPVLSDPDDRRDVEAAADAGEPMDMDFSSTAFALQPDATVTDTAGCSHRMSSGAVSLTACGECGADPGDDCAEPLGWRVHRPEAIRLGVLHPPAGANRLSWHAWLDELGVPRHAEPEQRTIGESPLAELGAIRDMQDTANADDRERLTATAPASCTERMALAVDTGEPVLIDRPCGECNAEPGEDCADPLEDRIAWRRRRLASEGGMERSERFWTVGSEAYGRAAMHRSLDALHVPRHGTRVGEQASGEDRTEAERVLDASAAKMGGTSPLESFMRETSAEIDALLAEHAKPHGTDPWWRRLLKGKT